ncbi:hypothetical protein AKO1_014153 [Acrasis kona]|uniref:Ras GEF n=1 Tax=Acrasis kona TaxID=1008807 RepID=A0AAW2Z0W9_9EUKA
MISPSGPVRVKSILMHQSPVEKRRRRSSALSKQAPTNGFKIPTENLSSEFANYLVSFGAQEIVDDYALDLGTYTTAPDSPENIQHNDDGTVKSATIEKLIENMLRDSSQEIQHIFFATYTSFTTSSKVSSIILSMYLPNGEDLTEAQKDSNKTIIELFIYWVSNYGQEICDNTLFSLLLFSAVANNNELNEALSCACKVRDKYGLAASLPLSMDWNSYLDSLPKTEEPEVEDEEEEEAEEEEENDDASPIIPDSWDGVTLDVLEWSPKELARQLTLVEQEYFSRIQTRECINDNFEKRRESKAPNISRLVDHFNSTSRWIVATILREEDSERRVLLLQHFIELASELIDFHNYQSLMAVGAAFNNSALFRLSNLWSQLDEEYIDIVEYMRELLDPSKKFKNLRAAMESPDSTPCIPYIGVIMSDLSAIESLYNELIDELVNFNKKRMSTKVLRSVQTYQKYKYPFERIPSLCECLKDTVLDSNDFSLLSEQELHKMSLSVQPRK